MERNKSENRKNKFNEKAIDNQRKEFMKKYCKHRKYMRK